MARTKEQRLKVYRTHIGFEDWVVAAPNQKAALAAWGVHADLFAAGLATVTDDEEAVAAARRTPGRPVSMTDMSRLQIPGTAKSNRRAKRGRS